MRCYFDTVLAPHWAAMSANHHADTAHRTRQIGAAGVERVFNTLHPDVRWSSPVLEIADQSDDEVDLGGRGLILPFYTWNLAGYQFGHGPSGNGVRHTFGGLTDAAFGLIPLLEARRDTGWPF